MNMFFHKFSEICSHLSDFVWSSPMLILLLFVGLLMTFGTKVFQVTRFSLWLKTSINTLFSKDSSQSTDSGNFSRFQALCTALASTIGTGNIIGTATAISMGGAGTVFWMWVSAFFGMMTAYSENVLGIYYRTKRKDGRTDGGPMYYIQKAFPKGRFCSRLSKALVYMFCISCVLASFGMGNMIQANSISSALSRSFGISEMKCGIFLSIVVCAVIIGGTKMIGRTTEKLVPFMAVLYIGCCLFVIAVNFRLIPHAFFGIVSSAFSFRAAFGAGTGLLVKRAISIGFRRGLCTNEAGLGSAVLAHSSSGVREPAVQGMMGIFVVFVDTIIICTLTALVLLSSSCTPVSLETALSGITREEKLVAITDEDGVDGQDVPIYNASLSSFYSIAHPSDPRSEKYQVTPENGIPFDVYIKKEESSFNNKTHTSIMSVRGVSLSSFGEEIKDDTLPVNAIKLEKVEGLSLATLAFSQRLGNLANYMIAVIVFLFAFSSILGWAFYGLKAWTYIFDRSQGFIFKALFTLCVFLGANMKLDAVWALSDIFNALMAFPNLIALILLSPKVFEITRNYINEKV